MQKKLIEREKAIQLRREGKTYSQIMKVVPVAKSTISLWLKEVGLSVPQQQNITAARIAAAKRGGEAKRKQRINKQKVLWAKAQAEILEITKHELFLIGVVLYWAEGTKEKDYHPGSRMAFVNSDPRMIKLFLTWLLDVVGVARDRISIEIFIHENHAYRITAVLQYWIEQTGFSADFFTKVRYKKNIITTLRKKVDDKTYFGLLKISVRHSSELMRMVTGWTNGIVDKVQEKFWEIV